jgi:RecC C-terminal domain
MAAGDAVDLSAATIPIDIELRGGHRLRGEVGGVRAGVALEITPTTLKPKHTLGAWLRLAALTCARPEVPWRVVVVGRGKGGPTTVHLTMRSPSDGARVIELVADLYWRARASIVPALAGTVHALHEEGRAAASKVWKGRPKMDESSDAWVRFALGDTDLDDILRQPPAVDEVGPEWGDAVSRLERWGHRIWTAVAATSVVVGTAEAEDDDDEVFVDGSASASA